MSHWHRLAAPGAGRGAVRAFAGLTLSGCVEVSELTFDRDFGGTDAAPASADAAAPGRDTGLPADGAPPRDFERVADAARPADAALLADLARPADAALAADAARAVDAAPPGDAAPALDGAPTADANSQRPDAAHDASAPPDAALRLHVAINLGGDSVVIEGDRWLSQAEAEAGGLLVELGAVFAGAPYAQPLSPPPEPATLTMLQSGVARLDAGNGQGFVVSFPVPAGRYRVYVWSMEDFRDHFRDLDLVVEGSPVATAIHDLPLWSWARFGPYAADVADGRLDVEVLRHSKGDPVINGLAVFTEVDAAPVH